MGFVCGLFLAISHSTDFKIMLNLRFISIKASVALLVSLCTLNWNLPVIAEEETNPPVTSQADGTDIGATRGSCAALEGTQPSTSKLPLTAIAPSAEMALTTQAYPTFFAYIPEAPNTTLEFTLQDEAGAEIYQKTFKTSDTPGIVSFTLPAAETSPLELNKTYVWFVQIECQTPQNFNREDTIVDEANTPTVFGKIRRIELNPPLSQQFNQASVETKTQIYTQASILYDALALLAEQRRLDPSDLTLTQNWNQLLTSMGYHHLISEPFSSIASTKME
jgi:hypothetical protein